MQTLSEDERKQAQCLRICGPDVTPDTHRTAPEMCPILQGYWLKLSTRPIYREIRKGQS